MLSNVQTGYVYNFFPFEGLRNAGFCTEACISENAIIIGKLVTDNG